MLKFGLMLLAGLAISDAANAACTQVDLAGTWQFYRYYGIGWLRCKTTINTAGMFSNTSCFNYLNERVTLTGGSAKISAGATCAYTAQFTLSTAGLNKVVHATLARDKITGNGVGTYGTGSMFFFSMTKL